MRRSTRGRLVALMVLLGTMVGPGLGGSTAGAQDQDPVDRRAPLIGHVVDREGRGVRGVCIDAYQVRETDHFGTVSGRNGRFILDTTSWGRPETYYEVRLVPCDGRLPMAPEWYPHADNWFERVPVKVRAGHTNHRDLTIRQQAVIEGTVTLLGRPVAGACVITKQWDQSRLEGADDAERIAYTDTAGRFRLTQLTPGSHPVAAYRDCSVAIADGGSVVLREGQTAHVALAVASVRS